MNRKGVCYDVGRVLMGMDWRPMFDVGEMHRELEIVKNDLHRNAVRICGHDVDRLATAGRDALEQGSRGLGLAGAVGQQPRGHARRRHGSGQTGRRSGKRPYQGAADAGGMGWAIVDLDIAELRKRSPRLKGHYVRDEGEQARELTEPFTIFDDAGVDGTFVFTFVAPTSPHSDDPRYDLDMARYSLVTSYGNRLGDLATDFPHLPRDAGPLENDVSGHAVGAETVVRGGRGLLRRAGTGSMTASTALIERGAQALSAGTVTAARR
jgi:hypothetical protein